MPSVTTQNLATAVSQAAPPQSQLNPSYQNLSTGLNQSQLAQLSRAAADRQLMNPRRNDENRTVQVAKRVESSFGAKAAKKIPGKGTPEEKNEERSRPHEDGLMDVVA